MCVHYSHLPQLVYLVILLSGGHTLEREREMSEQTTVPIPVVCSVCAVVRAVKPTPKGEPRTPAGWKRIKDVVTCDKCWNKKYILRAISMPVVSPLDCTWEELRTAMALMWGQTTSASNWMMTQLYARDVRRTPGDVKMPPMARVYLYPEARERFPSLPSQSIASLEESIQRKYRAKRYEVIWTCAASLPTHRYPTPFPVPAQGWSASTEDQRSVVSVRIGDQRWRLRLKQGPQFRRQLNSFRLIASGSAVPGELAIYEHDGIMVKIAAWLPRALTPELNESKLTVRTSADCLLIAINPKDEKIWSYNADHLRRWAAEHRNQLQRWAEDQKYEQRPVPSFAARRTAASRKFRDRMNSATHEIAAQLASYAARRRFGSVQYDDSNHAYLGDGFPWFRLRSLIEEKLDARGIKLELPASAPVVKKTREVLAVE